MAEQNNVNVNFKGEQRRAGKYCVEQKQHYGQATKT